MSKKSYCDRCKKQMCDEDERELGDTPSLFCIITIEEDDEEVDYEFCSAKCAIVWLKKYDEEEKKHLETLTYAPND
jgi:hypothetical protein